MAPLQRGVRIEDRRIAIVCESELFPEHAPQARRQSRAARDPEGLIRDLSELSQGAPVVLSTTGSVVISGCFYSMRAALVTIYEPGRDRTGSLSVRDQTQCDQPPALPGVALSRPVVWTQPRQSLEVLILPFDPPVFGRPAGRAPRATAWIHGVLDLRPLPQKSSPMVAVPHQVPQYPAVFERKQTGALSARNDIRRIGGSLWGSQVSSRFATSPGI